VLRASFATTAWTNLVLAAIVDLSVISTSATLVIDYVKSIILPEVEVKFPSRETIPVKVGLFEGAIPVSCLFVVPLLFTKSIIFVPFNNDDVASKI
jgi:hypothetical protein